MQVESLNSDIRLDEFNNNLKPLSQTENLPLFTVFPSYIDA